MAKRPTITDLARISGVSVATVDRVLNSRLPVREETARRVYEGDRDRLPRRGLIKQRMRHGCRVSARLPAAQGQLCLLQRVCTRA